MYKGPRLSSEVFRRNLSNIVGSFSSGDQYTIKSYHKMVEKRFQFISNNIDIGSNELTEKRYKGKIVYKPGGDPEKPVPVLIYDLREKLQPVIESCNARFGKFKSLTEHRIMAIDECLRASYSWLDQLRVYLPNKPKPYGEKFICCVDDQLYLHKMLVQYPAQFSTWTGLAGLMEQAVPKKFFDCGVSVISDNYFFTGDIVEYYHKKHISVLCTFRKDRAKKVMGKNLFDACIKQQPKSRFRRKIEIYERQLSFGQQQFIQFLFYHDKASKVPVLFATNDPRLLNTEQGTNISKSLIRNEKPPVSTKYNNNMFFVDQLDQSISEYTIAASYANKRWIRRHFTGN